MRILILFFFGLLGLANLKNAPDMAPNELKRVPRFNFDEPQARQITKNPGLLEISRDILLITYAHQTI